jgi:hypothetical protein
MVGKFGGDYLQASQPKPKRRMARGMEMKPK